MDLGRLIMIIISMVFINNFILSKFLGMCPFIGVSRETKPAISMGIAVTFVMAASSVITWLLYNYVLIPFEITYLRTITFILVIAAFVQFVEMVIRKVSVALYRALGIYLPLITTNCAILGVTLLNTNEFFKDNHAVAGSFLLGLAQSVFAGLGFTLALILMSAIRERLDLLDIPESMKGIPIAFVVASLMSLAFMGFGGFRF
ncbi:MAG: electron transport complex subunit RsxA [Candidatus Omnitrophica bacterium CG11_big_fil_rev_8_21_14_0_20_42_13]|uniref:Ion-translocating oxidoreductase complex subunit A n=1 Tax=Candidatus Ghiorseimicrobium undicola TaxID=1974746 RepID=A0A2H0LXD4_9BACT|nr:MAG: electron transport complex subunit RsxA [Candidatus Omnitrophica bacterium CG11_big_fil_rev_8_21_14_0_20_42_13]